MTEPARLPGLYTVEWSIIVALRTASKPLTLQEIAACILHPDEIDEDYDLGARIGTLISRLRRGGWPIASHRFHRNGLAFYSLPFMPERWVSVNRRTPKQRVSRPVIRDGNLHG